MAREALNKAIPGFVIARTSKTWLPMSFQDQVFATPDPGGASLRHGNAELISVRSFGSAEQSHPWLCHRTDIENVVSDVLQDQVIATPDPGGASLRHGNAELISVSPGACPSNRSPTSSLREDHSDRLPGGKTAKVRP